LAEQLHREGPSALSIRDPNYLLQIRASAHLTFEQRVRVIATLAMEWKARNDGLIKGDTLQTTVAAPLEALHSARANAEANKHRAEQLRFLREHQDAPKRNIQQRSECSFNHEQDYHTDIVTERLKTTAP
jgi:hypothetical protein